MSRNLSTRMVFVNLEKAYDTVPLKKLFDTLMSFGLSKTYVRAIWNIYKESKSLAATCAGRRYQKGNKAHSYESRESRIQAAIRVRTHNEDGGDKIAKEGIEILVKALDLTIFPSYSCDPAKSISSKTELSQNDLRQLKSRLDRAKGLIHLFNEIQMEIEALCDNFEEQLSEREQFEQDFESSIALAMELLETHSENDADSNNDSSVKSDIVIKSSNIVLPQISLPKFSGIAENWLEYRSTFETLIHFNEALNNLQKFHYLKASLEGTASQVIRPIQFTAENYGIAWSAICDEFDNSKLLIHEHVRALFQLEPIKEASADLKRLINDVSQHLTCLEMLGESKENLADPEFHTPAAIDMLLGGEIFWDLLCQGKISLGKNKPVLKETSLGWIIAGQIGGSRPDSGISNVCLNTELNNQLQKFWEIEEWHQEKIMSDEEAYCEANFKETTYRDENGRFVVSMPLKLAPALLGESRTIAESRLRSMEKRFAKNENLASSYLEFMAEYRQMGHMSLVSSDT
nr:unnamed protein product [Callosobruchus chinensis]